MATYNFWSELFQNDFIEAKRVDQIEVERRMVVTGVWEEQQGERDNERITILWVTKYTSIEGMGTKIHFNRRNKT